MINEFHAEKDKYQSSINNLIQCLKSKSSTKDSLNYSSLTSFLTENSDPAQTDPGKNSPELSREQELINLLVNYKQQNEDLSS